MNKEQLIKTLEDTLIEIKGGASSQKKTGLANIIERYKVTLIHLISDSLHHNEINISVKAYLEIYNDYDNSLLYNMSDAETAVKEYLNN